MNKLQKNLTEILRQKNEVLITDNVKKGVEYFGQIGTLDAVTSGGVKLFKTVEEMRNDETAKDGDIALVYDLEDVDYNDKFVVGDRFNKIVIKGQAASNSAPYNAFRNFYIATESGGFMAEVIGKPTTNMDITVQYYPEEGGDVKLFRLNYMRQILLDFESDDFRFERLKNGDILLHFGFECYFEDATLTTSNNTFAKAPKSKILGIYTYNIDNWIFADNQFTATEEDLRLGKVAYSENGEIVGTLNVPEGNFVKLFETVDEMNNDANAQEGDLATVYRKEIQNWDGQGTITDANFPNTVILPEAITDYISVNLRCDDAMFECWGDLSPDGFYLDAWNESGSIRVNYSTEDGITYTRIDGGEEYVDFGCEVYDTGSKYGEEWNEMLGYFFQVGGNYFEGLYEYKNSNRKNIQLGKLNFTTDYKITEYDTSVLSVEKIQNLWSSLPQSYIVRGGYFYKDSSGYHILTTASNLSVTAIAAVKPNSDGNYNLVVGTQNSPSSVPMDTYVMRIYNVSEDLSELVDFVEIGLDAEVGVYVPSIRYYLYTATSITTEYAPIPLGNPDIMLGSLCYYESNDNYKPIWDTAYKTSYVQQYLPVSTQLSATSDYVWDKTFYGKNGVEEGTLGNPDNTFIDNNAKLFAEMQNKYNDMEIRVLTDDDKEINEKICIIPSKNDGTPLLDTHNITDASNLFRFCYHLVAVPLLDTSNVTNMYNMFSSCLSLTTIPLLDTSKVTNMYEMFYNCSSLITIPLLDTSNVNRMQSMFHDCSSLITIPLLNTSNVTNTQHMFSNCKSLTEIPLLDTSKVTDMNGMFSYCTSLTEIPLLDTSSATSMNQLFGSCSNLSNESLNKVLLMCINARSMTSNKTLKWIGLSQEQTEVCKTLSNYSAFTSAGWTTGY